MPDPNQTDYFMLAIQRWDDGRVTVSASCDYWPEPLRVYRSRQYTPGTDIGEAVDDSARLLCGWAAMGGWGMLDAAENLRCR